MRRHRPFPIYWSPSSPSSSASPPCPPPPSPTATDAGSDRRHRPRGGPGACRTDAAGAERTGARRRRRRARSRRPRRSPATSPPRPSRRTTPAPETTTPATDPAPGAEHAAGERRRAAPGAASESTDDCGATRRADARRRRARAATPSRSCPDGIVRPIAFPVLGPVRYANGWGNCRDGCARRHVGTDMIGVRMQPLLAAVDGTITRIRYENDGHGRRRDHHHRRRRLVLQLLPRQQRHARAPTTALAGPEWQVSPQLTVGSPVRAGQVIGYMGDSGNAEGSVPHLHFEIRQPDRTPVNPYPSLVAAQQSPDVR